MLDFQNTKKAVFSPGLDSNYFDGLNLKGNPPVVTSGYAQANAWWLAELSRIVYRRSVGEDGMVLADRTTVLKNAGIGEELFVSSGPTQAVLLSGGTFHVLAFRGTESPDDWLRNLEMQPVRWEGGGRVHAGFLRALHEVWDQLHPKLQTIDGPVFYTGHSLGGALAVLAAGLIESARRPLAVYTYGGPRCGNATFAREHPLRDRIYRVVNNRDLVPNVPPVYSHTGELHYITSDKRLLTNPRTSEMLVDQLKDDDTHELFRDRILEQIADHAPVNYVAWMQRFANPDWVKRFSR